MGKAGRTVQDMGTGAGGLGWVHGSGLLASRTQITSMSELCQRTAPARVVPRRRTRRLVAASAGGNAGESPDNGVIDEAVDTLDDVRAKADRLHLLAEQARLEMRKAELEAERKRLELDQWRAERKQREREEEEKRRARQPSDVASIDRDETKDETSPDLQEVQKLLNELGLRDSLEIGDVIKLGRADGKITLQVQKDENTETNKDEKPGAEKTPAETTPRRKKPIFEIRLGPKLPIVKLEDIRTLKDKVFSIDTFFVTETEVSPLQDRVLFRGNLRTSPQAAYRGITHALEKTEIRDRYQLFLMEDPAMSERNVVVAISKEAGPQPPGWPAAFLSLGCLLASSLTLFGYGLGIFDVGPEVINDVNNGNLDAIARTLTVSVGTGLITLAHEVAHRVVAQLRGLRLNFPFFVPSLLIGSFGTVTPLTDFPKNRTDLFDFAIAGPLVGMVTSLVAAIVGLLLTASPENISSFPVVSTDLIAHSSVLLGLLSKIILPGGMLNETSTAVHPLVLVGYTGLLVNALNMIPIGRLDGGRVVQSLFGRNTASAVSALTVILQGLSSVLGNSPLLLFWGLAVVFLQREAEIPCQEELTEPSDSRAGLGLFMLFIMLLILAPFPQ
uniref:Peptidase M50 domain-containing protein n=1 Tax=Compsopogon caeruleus TaxID=31354 RepID=A0A7S1TER5_9RHOD|mmetsp:Transcript_17071/g.35539  ORF Transcript_17071/g.35539 Transcript_17071/m.35539 type:complete len:616 (+) Transcript_17071:252-2099(+)